MASRSGRSSRSSLMHTKRSFMYAAVASFSNDSRSITWHQWHAEEPIDSRIGRSSSRARARAASPHGYHSTGLSLCWRRYGEVSPARRLGMWSRLRVPAQERAPDLPARRLRQRVRELHDARVLVRRRLALHVVLELAGERVAGVVAGPQHHDRAHDRSTLG